MLIPAESPYWLDVDDVHLAIKFAREDLRRRRRVRQRWSLSLCVIAILIGLGHLVAYLTGDAPAINGFSFFELTRDVCERCRACP